MKEKYITSIIATFVFTLSHFLLYANNGVLQFGHQSVDLGKVYYDETYHITIPIKNIGTDPVQILRVDTDCGCSKATYSKEWLSVGDSAALSVDFKPTKEETPFYRTIVILTNSNISQYTLSLQGEVVASKREATISTNTYAVDWNPRKKSYPILSTYSLRVEGVKGEEVVYPLYISNLGLKSVVLNAFKGKEEVEVIQLPRTIGKGEVISFPIKVKLSKSGVFRDFFKLITDEKNILIRVQTIVNE